MTAHTIDTRVGKLELEHGFPANSQTVAKLYDEMDFQRATQAYLWAVPAVSFQSFQTGFFRSGVDYNDVVIFDNFLDTKTLALTGNDTTIYALSLINLAKDGPVVIEVPPGPTAGMVDDYWQRSQTMIGRPGPDKGQGGKFLLVPPGYQGELPADGYFIVPTSMNSMNFMLRGIVQNGDVPATAAMLKKIRVYTYSQREHPTPNRFVSATGSPADTLEPEGLDYWRRLSEFINNNPVQERDRFFMAMLKPLGIEKGKPFTPDERQKRILEEAELVGRAMAQANTFEPRLANATFYPGTHWMSCVLLDPSQEAENYSQLDERLHWFYIATYMNPAMALTKPGPGSVYIQTFKDKEGRWLDGTHAYRLRVPAKAPAEDFWSITAYDSQTRSMIQNRRNDAALSSEDKLKANADGSVDLYFGPTAPAGGDSNWIQTVSGKGFFVWFRAY